ncbi:MAG TPA: tripartite tricarboxylate transporter substrate binding protein [Caldimonas sp.]|jgi:tripartite-type tricarboxylate transporter receptor subunit TctC|nr:tripartite tricarboxylate transporter substrate binding protein [Caldimonas sp.]HEX2541656.1 tripartite tricarboxylate transporter substrate binding protein [Caldimonas sp.]
MRTLVAALLLTLASLVHAQGTFPTKPVRLVVAFPPGGSTDITARLLATKLATTWGQPVVVDNKPGAGANIGTAQVAKAPPDGHTLLLATTALSISPSVFAQVGYDALRDLAPITLVSTIPNVLVVHPDVPAKTIGEFIAHVRASPGKLNFAAPGASSGQRMTFELIKQVTNIDIVMVPYAGGAPALQAVLGGQVQAMIVNVAEATPHVRAGKLRALAVTTAKRAPMLPDVPTLAETVAPKVDTSVWQGLLAPAGTPEAVIRKIRDDTAAVLAMRDVQDKLAGMGMEIVPGTPEEFARFLRDDIETWRRVSKAAAIQPE